MFLHIVRYGAPNVFNVCSTSANKSKDKWIDLKTSKYVSITLILKKSIFFIHTDLFFPLDSYIKPHKMQGHWFTVLLS